MVVKFVDDNPDVVETYFIVNPTEDDKIMMTPKLIEDYFTDGKQEDAFTLHGASIDYNEKANCLIVMITTKLDFSKLIEIAAIASYKRYMSLINPDDDPKINERLEKFKKDNFDISLMWVAKDSALIYEAMTRAIQTMVQMELTEKKAKDN